MSYKLSIGEEAPNFNFETPWESPTSFYNESANRIAILIFLRYIGCPVCQVEMSKIKQDIYLAERKNAVVFIVLQSSPDSITPISNKKDWPFTIICDPKAKIFKQYYVEPGGILKYLHPYGLWSAVKAILAGIRHGKFEGKETQLPASFVISADKKIKYVYYGQRIDDVPSLETLVGHIE